MKLIKKLLGKKIFVVGVSLLTITLAVGCYNVSYEILQAGSEGGSETVKSFVALGEVTQYQNQSGDFRLTVEDTTDRTAGKIESIPHNKHVRIPTSLLIPAGSMLPNGQIIGSSGRLLVAGDARWGCDFDLPSKASCWTRFSEDGGQTWSRMALAIHYEDIQQDKIGAYNYDGIATVDPTIGRTADNRIIMLTTTGSVSSGAWAEGKLDRDGDPYFQEACSCQDARDNDWCRCEGKTWYLRLRVNHKNYSRAASDSGVDSAGAEGSADNTVYHLKSLGSNSIGGVTVSNYPEQDAFNKDDWIGEEYHASAGQYCYYVDVKGGEIMKADGNGTTSGATGTGLYVDKNYFLYLDRDLKYPYYVKQLTNSGLGTKDIHCHLFMGLSPFIVWRGTTYTFMSYSDDGGVTWSTPQDITYMVRPKDNSLDTSYFFVSPCGGYLHDGLNEDVAAKQGDNKRLVFSAYRGGTGGEAPVAFWTDDGGETWFHADAGTTDGSNPLDEYMKENGTGNSSETTIVGHPKGALIAISRGTPPQWHVSKDGGKTWDPQGTLTIPEITPRNLMSAVVLDWSTSPSGNPLIALSSATGGNRSNGYVYILEITEAGGNYSLNYNWAGTLTRTSIDSGDYAYSSVCELANGNLIVFHEGAGSDIYVKYVQVERR